MRAECPASGGQEAASACTFAIADGLVAPIPNQLNLGKGPQSMLCTNAPNTFTLCGAVQSSSRDQSGFGRAVLADTKPCLFEGGGVADKPSIYKAKEKEKKARGRG